MEQADQRKESFFDRAAIAGYIAEQNLSYKMSDLFLPVLITIFPYDQSLGKEDKDLFDYAFSTCCPNYSRTRSSRLKPLWNIRITIGWSC